MSPSDELVLQSVVRSFVSRVGSLQKTTAGVEMETVSMKGFTPSDCR
jgi:hypothetical protein